MNTYEEDDWVVVSLPPKFASHHALQFSVVCKEHVQKGNRKFLADASDLAYIDSYGISVLLMQLQNLQDIGGDIRIRNLRGEVLNIFVKSGLVGVFEIENDNSPCDEGKAVLGIAASNFGLELTEEVVGEVILFRFFGSMKFPNGVKKFKDLVSCTMDVKNKCVLDFEMLEYLDSHSVDEILDFAQRSKESGESVRIWRPNEFVKDLLTMLGVDQVIPIYDTAQNPLEDWKPEQGDGA